MQRANHMTHDEELALAAERAVLAAVLLSASAIDQAREMLHAEDFARVAHQKLFSAAVALATRNEPVDLITVVEELRKRGDLNVVGGPGVVAQVLDYATATQNLKAHARVVREHSQIRQARRLAYRLYQAVERDPGRALEILLEHTPAILAAAERRDA